MVLERNIEYLIIIVIQGILKMKMEIFITIRITNLLKLDFLGSMVNQNMKLMKELGKSYKCINKKKHTYQR